MLAKWAEIPVAESLLPDMRRNEFWGNGRLQNRTRFKLLLCLLSTLHEHTGVLITAVLEFVDWSRELGAGYDSSNVYSDLEYVDAEAMQRKSERAFAISERILDRDLTLELASKIVQLMPKTLFHICRGQLRSVSEGELIEIHARLS